MLWASMGTSGYTGITQSFAAVILGLIFCNSKLLFDFLVVMMEDQQTAPLFFWSGVGEVGMQDPKP